MKGERFQARVVGHTGREVGRWTADTIAGAMSLADKNSPNKMYDASVRGEYTSDGTKWPNFGGRMVAVREGGRWSRL